MIKKIIAGGQPGVEIAVLDAAIRLGIPHEGWCYRDKKTGGGVLGSRYNVKEIDNPSYFERLEKNIIDSDGTVVLSYGRLVFGSIAVKNLTEKNNKPCLNVNLSEHPLNHAISLIRRWMTNHGIAQIYFTGSKKGGGLGANVYDEVIQIIEGICGVEREQFLGFQEEDDIDD
ncbi:MAG: hypothetical protein JRF56_22930 [Deltaproteobacteria bacterium]|jgi:hypothetical protein|nr:hypothetical protein [Deltaproteobacteria bacterium]